MYSCELEFSLSYSEFQASLGYRLRLCLKKPNYWEDVFPSLVIMKEAFSITMAT